MWSYTLARLLLLPFHISYLGLIFPALGMTGSKYGVKNMFGWDPEENKGRVDSSTHLMNRGPTLL